MPLLLILVILSVSCVSEEEARRRLEPPSPPVLTEEARLEAIKAALPAEPEKALYLIAVYRSIYGQDTGIQGQLDALWQEALTALEAAKDKAVSDKAWSQAASLLRSLEAVGVRQEEGTEAGYLLENAKALLAKGEILAAFLAAREAAVKGALSAEDSLLFFEAAVTGKQRRTAAFFLHSMEAAGGKADAEKREWALGRDSAAAMIRGMATVLVDRGIRVERGLGAPDRVLGTAFFVDASGLLVTNCHVVESEIDPKYEGYSRMYIRLGDSASARTPARVVGWDKTIDIAVIKAEVKPEYVFSVVDFASPGVGEETLVIGSPVGLEQTVTRGIVSALGRRFLQIGDVFQLDAAVNSGNSGGPVLDTEGRLLGVIFAGAESYEGLNFAIPASRLAAALPGILEAKSGVKRPWLGLALSENRASPQGTSARVVYVAPDTPASEMRTPESSLITGLAGKSVTGTDERGGIISAMQDILFTRKPGELVTLETANGESGGKTRLLRLAERPELPLAWAAKADRRERLVTPLFGLILGNPAGGAASPRYMVKSVVRGSVADEAGLSPQDPVVIRSLRIEEKDGYALLDIDVKKRLSGYLETTMRLPAALDSPDTL